MVYSEYREAAIRHMQTCQNLIIRIKSSFNIKEKERILINTYYLSGYIIETIVSYTIFYLIRYDQTKDVKKLNNDNGFGIRFYGFFSNHDFAPKVSFIKSHGGTLVESIPIIGNAPVSHEEQRMFDEWKPDLRYSSKYLSFTLTEIDVKNFLELANKIYIGLRKI